MQRVMSAAKHRVASLSKLAELTEVKIGDKPVLLAKV